MSSISIWGNMFRKLAAPYCSCVASPSTLRVVKFSLRELIISASSVFVFQWGASCTFLSPPRHFEHSRHVWSGKKYISCEKRFHLFFFASSSAILLMCSHIKLHNSPSKIWMALCSTTRIMIIIKKGKLLWCWLGKVFFPFSTGDFSSWLSPTWTSSLSMLTTSSLKNEKSCRETTRTIDDGGMRWRDEDGNAKLFNFNLQQKW